MSFKLFLKNKILELNDIINLTVEGQSYYTDILYRPYVNYNILKEEIENEINKNKRLAFMKFNVTSIGNIAFICLNFKTEENKIYLENVLFEFKKFWLDDGSKHIDEIIELQYSQYTDIESTTPPSKSVSIN